MLIGGLDFNIKLAKLKPKAFAKFYKDCKYEDKLGVKAADAHKLLNGEKIETK